MGFPRDFLWGAATSAYQIEGAARLDGRGESIWDRFSHTPGNVWNNENGDIACDHYHRFADDIRLMASFGIRSYRFSVAWPRILPMGAGRVNEKGLDFYRRLIEELLRNGITPAATIYHWDLPQVLQDQGGWVNRDVAYRFAEYADILFRAFGGLVPLWITHNEPWCTAFLGYALGQHAPGLQDALAALRASHHILLSHGLAVQAFRATAPSTASVGIALNLAPAYPASESAADLAATRRQDGFQNRWFLDPLFKKEYPADMIDHYSGWTMLDYILPEDLATIAAPIDFLGVNYYSRSVVRDDPSEKYLRIGGVPPKRPVTAMGWEVAPESLTDLLTRLRSDYGDIPIYITENGAAFADEPDASGAVDDPQRVAFLRTHLASALQAMEKGVPVRGYYVWSFLDNFEWAFGYSKRFGLVYVDYATQERIPKKSAHWYRDVIEGNGVD